MENISITITVVSIIITTASIFIAIYQIYLREKSFLLIGKARRNSLRGKWIGNFNQNRLLPDGDKVGGSLEVEFKIGRKRVKGDITYNIQTEANFLAGKKIALNGGFRDQRFLSFAYNNPNLAEIQFGTIILELSANSRTLNGMYVGYGSESEMILTGEVFLQKVA